MPQIFIIPGVRNERHDLLVDRLYERRIILWSSIAKRPTPALLRMSVQPFLPIARFSNLFCIELRDELDRTLSDLSHRFGSSNSLNAVDVLPASSSYSFAALEFTVRAERCPENSLAAFLNWFINKFFRGWTYKTTTTQILSFINITYPEKSSNTPLALFRRDNVMKRVRAQLNMVFPKGSRTLNEAPSSDGAPCITLSELYSVSAEDIVDWLDECGFYTEFAARESAARRIMRKAARWTSTAPMDSVASCLDSFRLCFSEGMRYPCKKITDSMRDPVRR
jgi:hypothetical protein